MGNQNDFDKSFERVIGNEGGFQRDPRDRGNWTSGQVGRGRLVGTKYGIAAMSYPDVDIKNLTLDEAKRIYLKEWWIPLKMESMPSAIVFQLFDAAINHGKSRAVKMLQKAVRADADGIIGPRTLERIRFTDPDDLVLLFLAERLEYFVKVPTWNEYSVGWTRRVAHNLRYAAEDN